MGEPIFIPAGQLHIVDKDNADNWIWPLGPQGFAQLVADTVLNIEGVIDTGLLTTPRYGVYLVYQLGDNDRLNVDEAYAAVGTEEFHLITLHPPPPPPSRPPRLPPHVQNDGLNYVMLGVYPNSPEGGHRELLNIRLKGIDDYNEKRGLIVWGIIIAHPPGP